MGPTRRTKYVSINKIVKMEYIQSYIKRGEKMDNKLKGKDLITIGIYTAIYFVINFVFMLSGMIPVMWIFMPALIALFTGIPYMMICNKVQKQEQF